MSMPQNPQAPATPRPGNAAVPQVAGPTTRAELIALQAKQSVLTQQVNSLVARRAELSKQLLIAGGRDRQGLEQIIGQLDQRILSVQGELDATTSQIAEASPQLAQTITVPSAPPFTGPRFDDSVIPVMFLGISFLLLFPFSIVMARRMWHRTPKSPRASGSDGSSERLKRLEEAVDSIAVEVERISEGQRFVTKLLTERQSAPAAALAAGDGPLQSVPIRERERA